MRGHFLTQDTGNRSNNNNKNNDITTTTTTSTTINNSNNNSDNSSNSGLPEENPSDLTDDNPASQIIFRSHIR